MVDAIERDLMELSPNLNAIRNQSSTLSMLILAIGFLCAVPVEAQEAPPPAAPGSNPTETTVLMAAYDSRNEIQLQGAIRRIETAGEDGPIGTHILIRTATGVVDAHLGYGRAASPTYLGLATGESVTVIGMIERAEGKDILLTRILGTSKHVFILRSQHGIPVRGTARTSSAPSKALQGGL
jgi:hypothetical protein